VVFEAPSRQELIAFLKYFTLCVKVEKTEQGNKKHLSDERSQALTNLLNWIETNPSCAFTAININRFTFELALRIRRPSIVKQLQLNFCGQAAICYAYAKENPVGFATFAMSVVSTGQGVFRAAQIIASTFVLSRVPPVGMPCVDYVILSSMRCSLGTTSILENVLLSTHPSLLAGSMRAIGYKLVEEHVLGVKRVKSFEYTDAIQTSRTIKLLSEGITSVPGSKQTSLTDVDQRKKQLECLTLAGNKSRAGHVVIMGIDATI
jgi:hypothetical protein